VLVVCLLGFVENSAMSADDGAPIAVRLVELRFSRCLKSSFVV